MAEVPSSAESLRRASPSFTRPAGSKRVRDTAEGAPCSGDHEQPGGEQVSEWADLAREFANSQDLPRRQASAELRHIALESIVPTVVAAARTETDTSSGDATAVVSAVVSASEERSEQTGDRHLSAAISASGNSAVGLSSLDDTAQQPRPRAETAGDALPSLDGGQQQKVIRQQPEPAASAAGPTAASAPPIAPPTAAVPPSRPVYAGGGSMGTSRPFCPPHGAKAICGRRARMEDAYTAVPFLLEVPMPGSGLGLEELVPPRIATQVKSASGSDSQDSDAESTETPAASEPGSAAGGAPSPANGPPAMDALHFFGVFDGHGGAEAALHCARTLHEHIAEALNSRSPAAPPPAEAFNAASGSGFASAEAVAAAAKAAQKGAAGGGDAASESGGGSDFMDTDILDAHLDSASRSEACDVSHFDNAFTNAFLKTDEEFGKVDNAALVGTTAVVALIGDRQIYVGNCGDSRAVLCRSGVAIPLTDDHKAAREDETARVEAAGGQILFWNGVRVMGVLAVSRAIGDHCLRPFVIAQPEVTILGRHDHDELLLLASDGLWDVLSNQEACSLAKRCLRRARQRGASRHSAARIAATVLTRAAVDRGSRDNVTVVVVDLSREELDDEPEEEGDDEDGGRRGDSMDGPSRSETDTNSRGHRSGDRSGGHRRHRSQPAVIAGPHNEDARDSHTSASAARSAEEARRSRSRQEARQSADAV